jgi:hypothetical protein
MKKLRRNLFAQYAVQWEQTTWYNLYYVGRKHRGFVDDERAYNFRYHFADLMVIFHSY